MRDFRNAKAMAKTLRDAFADRSLEISHSESLELIAHVFGCRNWQTLAATIEAHPADLVGPGAAEPSSSILVNTILLPAIPMRDVVVLPDMTLPLYVGRAKTLRAIDRAMAGDRRLFLITQKREGDETPTAADLYEVGVVAVILQSMRRPDGTMKVTVQAERRARLKQLTDGEMLQAEVEIIEAASSGNANQNLARETLERFGRFANLDLAALPIAMARLPRMVEHPGALADEITPMIATRLDQAQALLEMTDPSRRLKKLIALMDGEQKAA